MKTFCFEIELRELGYRRMRYVRSNHLQRAIRKLYQNEQRPLELKKILSE